MVVGITTYNREGSCQALVDSLKSQGAKVVVLRDGGKVYKIKGAHNYAKEGGGRQGYVNTFRELMRFVLRHSSEGELCAFMPDDVEIHKSTLTEIDFHWHNVYESVAVLGLLTDNRCYKSSFGSGRPYTQNVDGESYIRESWVDGCFVTNREILSKMEVKDPSDYFLKNVNSGSGLGHKLSEAARRIGEVWTVAYSLVNHLGHDSVMNPTERKAYPLITNWKPPVSIIIPYKKDRGYLDLSIASAEAQDYEGDIDIIESQSSNYVGHNINEALKVSEGHYWRYLCDDDLIPSDATTKQVSAMNYGYDIVHANSLHFTPASEKLVVPQKAEFSSRELARKNYINGGSCMYRTSKTQEVGCFDESLWTGEELEFHLRMLANGAKLGYINEITYKYRRHGAQKSKSRSSQRIEAIKAIRAKYKG